MMDRAQLADFLRRRRAPHRTLRTDHVNPGLMRVLDRLTDTPTQAMTSLGETLVQTRLAVALHCSGRGEGAASIPSPPAAPASFPLIPEQVQYQST